MSLLGGRRVQRVPESWPVVHLEPEPPDWDGLVVDGLVGQPCRFGLDDLAALGAERRTMALHCVWGWSRPDAEWAGVGVDRVLAAVGARGSHVTVRASSGPYSACHRVEDAAAGILAWGRDGADLEPEAGGPLRFVTPPTHWAYKGVKWAGRITVTDRFVPGFWEARVDNPGGRIPPDVELP